MYNKSDILKETNKLLIGKVRLTFGELKEQVCQNLNAQPSQIDAVKSIIDAHIKRLVREGSFTIRKRIF